MSAHTAPCSSGAYRAARPSGLARLLAGLALLALCLPALAQRIIEATPDDYRQHLAGLQAGDTLRLAPGTYTDGLPLRRLAGRADAPIIITGPDDGDKALFLGRDGRITISLIDVSHLTLRHLELDGRGTRGHAIVAEGRGTHADHITLEHLHIHGYDAAQAFNAISTKTPAWNWIIRHNHIHDVGTGLYLGDSDGSAPFVAGLIEGNTFERTLGYNAQIKHQLPRPTLPGMPTGVSETIIRHNVFDKSERGNTGNRARPNLLLGHWPLEGPGQHDRYLVHDNLFHQNPTERLFQAEGNVVAWNNRFINLHGRAVSFQAHNDVPRMIEFHDNTVIGRGPAVSLSGADAASTQTASDNRIYGETPPSGIFAEGNRFASLEEAPEMARNSAPAETNQAASRSGSALEAIAATLEPGTFQPLETGLPPGVERLADLFRGYREDGSSAPAIDTWTDSAQWDSVRQQIVFQGLRQSNRFLTYDVQNNMWAEIPLEGDAAPPKFERFGHLYGRTALDSKRGHFYRLASDNLHRYDFASGQWRVFRNAPLSGYISIDWNSQRDMLVGLAGHNVHGFRDGRWEHLGTINVHGYHSSAKFNSVRGDMLFIGGNHSRSRVSLLTAQGALRNMADAPFEFTIRSDNLTYDPNSGNYLVLHRDRVLWEYHPESDEWRVALDMRDDQAPWPFARSGIVPAVINDLGVVVWLQTRAPLVYRHPSAFSAEPPPRHARTGPVPRDATRPKPHIPHVIAKSNPDSLIEREARTMEPGEWRNLAEKTKWPGKTEGVSFKSFQYLRTIDGDGGGSGADGMGWTQNLVYHRGKLMMLLMRDHLERALMVMEADGTFWRSNQPEGFDQESHRRPFNKLAQDDTYLYYSPNIGRERLGEMIRTPLDNPGVFEPFGIPIGDSQISGQFAATYVSEWGRFYAYTPGGKIWSWAEGETHWTQHGDMPRDDNGHRLSGYAGLLLWNPVRKELVIVGGQNFGGSPQTSHKVYRLTDPLGSPEMLPDRQGPDGGLLRWNSGGSRLIVDPRDGTYLMLTGRTQLLRGDCAGGRFEPYENLSEMRPFGAYEPYAPVAHVPGTDVLVFLSHIRGLVLHRLQPARHATPPDCPSAERVARPAQSATLPPAPSAPQTTRTPSTKRPDHTATPSQPEPHSRPETPPPQRQEVTQSGNADISVNTPRNTPAGSARELSPADIRALRMRSSTQD